jgi:ATP-dependent Lhr-like helicase
VSLLDLLDSPAPSAALPDRFQKWFAARGWSPREHQLALLKKARENRSALLIAPTGAGKTLAGFLPTLVELSDGLNLPLKGGGRHAKHGGWGAAAGTEQAAGAPPHPPPTTGGGGAGGAEARG